MRNLVREETKELLWSSIKVADIFLAPSPVRDRFASDARVHARKRASTSSPGLDGIPYEAYKRAPNVWHILQRAGKELYARGEEAYIPKESNWSRCVCLPKKAAGTPLP